ncbi:MAG TPA: GNAT family N-acetyltransferase [Candidatus Acidoferrum sp.]|nr:GNAT family N-acetyltransferase [Candidatus Acidoferrum sp.]
MVPVIRTARLELVSFSLDAMRATLANDLATVSAELGAEVPGDLAEALGGLFQMRIAQLESDPTGVPWLARAMVITEHGGVRRQVGSIGFHQPPVDGVVEIGYSVEPAYRHQGIATEAVRAMLDWAAEQGVHSIRASVSPTNLASQRVIARFGFRQTGVQWDEEDGEELVYMTTWPPLVEAQPHVA